MINQIIFLGLLFFVGVVSTYSVVIVNNTENFAKQKVLSRKKRFLIFPEGSSVQLVLCLSYPTVFNIGEIFLFGNTAAMAWELPQDPYSPFHHLADPLHRRVDTKTVYYTNDKGRVMYTKPYKRKSILNPAFAKRSVNSTSKSGAYVNEKMDHLQMHKLQEKRDFFKSELMDGRQLNFHRSSRVGLYEKIEILYRALGSNGRECVLKSLCETGQSMLKPQGTFFEELMRAIFTLPYGKEFEIEHHKAYDVAHKSTGDCDRLYPECTAATLDPTMPRFSY